MKYIASITNLKRSEYFRKGKYCAPIVIKKESSVKLNITDLYVAARKVIDYTRIKEKETCVFEINLLYKNKTDKKWKRNWEVLSINNKGKIEVLYNK